MTDQTRECKHPGRCRVCHGVDLLDQGHYFYQAEIDSCIVEDVRADLLKMALDRVHEVRPGLSETITVHLDSGGGEVTAGFALAGTIRYIQDELQIPVDGRVEGWAASMATVVLQFFRNREAGPNAMFMLHEASSWNVGKYSDQKDHIKATERWMAMITKMYAKRSAQHPDPQWWADQLERRDWWMTAEEALNVGLIDRII